MKFGNLTNWVTVLTMTLGVGIGCLAAEPADFAEARARRRAFGEKLMETILAAKNDKHTSDVVYALAGLYTGKDEAGANQRLREALKKAVGGKDEMTVEGATSVKWQMRTWLRIYYLFNDKSAFFPGRLAADVQAQMEELFFLYGSGKSTLQRANLDYIWFIQGSENHDMMDLSNAYLALQAVQKLPAYKDRKLPDGHTPAEHVKAWEKYYAQYALERAKNGLFVEISPTYGKWFIGEIVNMYEFADDPVVRQRMKLLLDLTWADWSVDQLNGIRGGGKTRCYQGHYSQLGASDSWSLMGRALIGMEGWYSTNAGIQSQLILSTSRYELPDIVLDMALNREKTKPFVYQSTRPAKLATDSKHMPDWEGYWMDGSGGRMLRYSYCTPECILGSWILDTRIAYAAINTQNRWQGVIFSTGPAMRVFPESVGLGNGKTYNQHVAVQHRNVMVVAAHPQAKQAGQMRVYFPHALRDRIVEKNGWVIVKEGGAWLGVRVLSKQHAATAKNYEFKDGEKGQGNGFWLWPKEDKPPVAFVVSQVNTHKTLEDFLAYLSSHESSVTDGRVTYSFADDLGANSRLEVGGELPVPRVNGQPVNLQPENVFASPWMNSVHGSGIVTIQKGEQKLTLDFTKPSQENSAEDKMQKGTKNSPDQKAFEEASAGEWQEVFSDACTGDWQQQWFLDGEVGTVKNGPEGMTLTAGPEFKNDAHHLVLWTKPSFTGDLKIEYDYTRLDNENRCVNILYIQATGSGKGPYAKDISQWNELRKVPAMSVYYDHLHTYHISYAAFPEGYIRGRRYLPEQKGLKGTDLKPDYYPQGLFATGVKHHITVIKKDRDLFLRIENPEQVFYGHMTNPDLPIVTEGRVGLRHMFTRSACYKNFMIHTRPESNNQ